MKLSELSAELSDLTPEQAEYDVIVQDGEDELEVDDAMWDHQEKKLVLKI